MFFTTYLSLYTHSGDGTLQSRLSTASCLHLRADDNNNQWGVMKREVLTSSKHRLLLSIRRGFKSRRLHLPGIVTFLDFSRKSKRKKNERKKLERIVSQLATQIDGERRRDRKVLFKRRCVKTSLHDIISYIKCNSWSPPYQTISNLWTLAQQTTLFVEVLIVPPQCLFLSTFCILHATCWSAFQKKFCPHFIWDFEIHRIVIYGMTS